MGLTKYTKAEGHAQVLSKDAHKQAQRSLHKQGHTSAESLSDEEREKFASELRQAE